MILNKLQVITSATRQARPRWFSVGIFPPGLLFGLTGNRPQSAPACSFLRYNPIFSRLKYSSSVIGKSQKESFPFAGIGLAKSTGLARTQL